MKRFLVIAGVALMIGCSQSTDTDSSNSGAASTSEPAAQHGRVTLRDYKVEMGNPDASAVLTGLDSVTSAINDLLGNDDLKPATGTLIGRFRLEADGTLRMFLGDKTTSIENVEDGALAEALVGVAFSGKCSFPELGDVSLVYAEFEIQSPE